MMESRVMDKILGVKPSEVPFRIDEAAAIFQYAKGDALRAASYAFTLGWLKAREGRHG